TNQLFPRTITGRVPPATWASATPLAPAGLTRTTARAAVIRAVQRARLLVRIGLLLSLLGTDTIAAFAPCPCIGAICGQGGVAPGIAWPGCGYLSAGASA